VTTLADGVRRYINGIKDYGDLDFTFLYSNEDDNASFRKIREFEKAGKKVSVKIGVPGEDGTADQTTFTFDAVLSAGLNEAGVNDPLTYTVTAGLQSDIVIAPDAD
jgi:ribosomal protein L10